MSRKIKASLMLIISLVMITMTISSASGADIGYYSGDYTSHKLFCKGNYFYSLHYGTNSAVGTVYSENLKNIQSSDFVTYDSQILTCFQLSGDFYAVCHGMSYDTPSTNDFMVFKGDSMSSMYLQYTKHSSSFSLNSAAADSHLNIYAVDYGYGGDIKSVSATSERVSTYHIGTKNIDCITNNDSLSFVALASQNKVYVKSADATEFSLAATLGENITRLYFLSDNYILCNGQYIVDVYGGYLGSLGKFSYESQGCYCNNYFYITVGSTVVKYDALLNCVKEYPVNGNALDCAVCNNTAAVLADSGGKLCIFLLTDKSENDSPSPSASENKNSPKAKDSDKSGKSTKANTSSYITEKTADTDCSVIYITQGTTVAKLLKSDIFEDNNVAFENYSGVSITSGKLGTGATITNSASGDKYSVVLTGDITGEGNINSKDINNFCDALVGNRVFSSAQSFAADVNKDGQIDLLDLLCDEKITEGKYKPKY
ncbi:MAG: dockerin type I repeat-containing protein [Clostridiales bacterium]|nr:dockerin type I repeat-containing protein [Clostridiales bacterium]